MSTENTLRGQTVSWLSNWHKTERAYAKKRTELHAEHRTTLTDPLRQRGVACTWTCGHVQKTSRRASAPFPAACTQACSKSLIFEWNVFLLHASLRLPDIATASYHVDRMEAPTLNKERLVLPCIHTVTCRGIWSWKRGRAAFPAVHVSPDPNQAPHTRWRVAKPKVCSRFLPCDNYHTRALIRSAAQPLRECKLLDFQLVIVCMVLGRECTSACQTIHTHTHTLPQAPPTLMICNAAGGKHNYVSGGGSCRAGGRGHPERSGGVPDVAAPLVWSETLSWAVRGPVQSRARSQVCSSVLVTAQPAWVSDQ